MNKITLQRLQQALSYDPDTGLFRWRITLSSKAPAGSIAGTLTKRGCIAIGIDGKQYKAHHLAWLWTTGAWPEYEIDHRDTVQTNNARANLRDVPHQVNTQNHRRPRTANKLGLLGVCLCKQTGRYQAQITVGGKNKKIGRFATPELAHAAYVSAKRSMHDGCTL